MITFGDSAVFIEHNDNENLLRIHIKCFVKLLKDEAKKQPPFIKGIKQRGY